MIRSFAALLLVLPALVFPHAAAAANGNPYAAVLAALGAGACGSRNQAALAALPAAAPDAAAMPDLLSQLQDDYAAREGRQHIEALKQAFHQTGADNLDDLGAVLYMTGHLKASIYTFAQLAQQFPDSANAYTNLGAALNDAGDYTNAVKVLRYALKLDPADGIAASNLAIVYARLGDRKTAAAMLNASLKTLPGQLEANLALAELARCANDPKRATRAVRRAQKIKPTKRGRKIIKQIAAGTDKPDGWVDADSFSEPPPAGPAPDVAHPPAFPDKAANYARWVRPVSQAMLEMTRDEGTLLRSAAAVGIGNIPDNGLTAHQLNMQQMARTLRGQSRTLYYISQDAEFEHFINLADVYSDRIAAAGIPFEEQGERNADILSELDDQDFLAYGANAMKVFCARYTDAETRAYAGFKSAYAQEFDAVSGLIIEYYKRSNALLAEFSDPDDARALDLWRRSQVKGWEANLWADAANAYAITAYGICGDQSAAQKGKPDAGNLPAGKGGKCNVNLGIDIGLFAVSVDCKKFEISGGEGLVGTFDWDYKNKIGTVYLGVGASAGGQINLGAASVGPELGGEVGVTFTFDGRNGDFLDGGVYGKGEAKLFNTPMTTGNGLAQNVDASASATWTVANGLDTT
ncbi:MAG TPA: tetratricopeptide repeat protein [Gammaproteobacteria bacterium]|nr:tetratricopeptide repeat protein [Gammaproteobacteria bacterium]